jgi:hypothetical protein
MVEPPRTDEEALLAEEAAATNARELENRRKSMPRVKSSPTTDKAMAFLIREGVTVVTKEVVEKAAGEGIKRRTLYLASSILLEE